MNNMDNSFILVSIGYTNLEMEFHCKLSLPLLKMVFWLQKDQMQKKIKYSQAYVPSH